MLTVVSFVLGLGFLIAVHEYGHYRMALACGVRVIRFSIGFGKPLIRWRFRHDGTEFVIAMLPLGGFVQMLNEREGPVAPADRQMAFNTQPLRNRAMVVLAGPMANLLLAVLIYALVAWWGVQLPKPVLSSPAVGSVAEAAGLRSGDWVTGVRFADGEQQPVSSYDDLVWALTQSAMSGDDLELSVTRQQGSAEVRLHTLQLSDLNAQELDAKLFARIGLLGPFTPPLVSGVVPDGPAAQAGLMAGDLVLKLGHIKVSDAQQLRDLIRRAGGGLSAQSGTQTWTLLRDGNVIELALSPKSERKDGIWVGRAGVVLGAPPETVLVRSNWAHSIAQGFTKTWEMSWLSLKMMSKVVTGEASLTNLSGPLTIADYAGKSAQSGIISYALFLAMISVSLGVLNLLPIPVLDGGHLMYYLYEAVIGREPSDLWLDRLQRVGMALLLGVMAVALFNDVARIWG